MDDKGRYQVIITDESNPFTDKHNMLSSTLPEQRPVSQMQNRTLTKTNLLGQSGPIEVQVSRSNNNSTANSISPYLKKVQQSEQGV